MICFLADASLNDAIPSGCLRKEPRMDFRSAKDAHLEGVPDLDVLSIAAEQERILITHDYRTMPAYFGEFLAAGRSSPGVFLVKQRTPVTEVIEALVLVCMATEPNEWRDRIVEIPLR
jgi:hypothetical protein